ncbi:MAG: hypothetical protein WB586_19830 [Chthoniobacterales bacterium]
MPTTTDNCLFRSIHVPIEPIGPGIVTHDPDCLVGSLSGQQDWVR